MTSPHGDDLRILTGLAGRGIMQSRTPWMHEQEGAAQGLRLVYTLLDFTERGWDDGHLPALLDSVEKAGFAGINVTFPFKQSVVAFLDDLSESARRVGAVNTVSFVDGKRIGHNTDVTGFAESISTGLVGADLSTVLQLGCGGAGAATAYALLSGKTEILHLHDVDPVRRDALIAQLSSVYGQSRVVAVDDLDQVSGHVSGIVNATPMGMDKFPGMALPESAIHPRHWVADIVYFPIETQLLRTARLQGCRTLDGSGMAIHQAASAFEIFTGLKPNLLRMSRSFADFADNRSDQAA